MTPTIPKSLAAFAFVLFAALGSSALAAAPTLTSFSPGAGVLRQTVTITGTGFVSPATVTFNGVAATTVTVSSSTSIIASVPNTATSGKIAVSDSGGTATSTGTFTVNPGVAPALSTATPGASGPVYFSAFGAFELVDLYFDETPFGLASASSVGAGTFTVTIPATATPGTHWITAGGRKSGYSAQVSYLVRTDWPQTGFRPNHRGRDAFENVVSTANVDQLDESWRSPGLIEADGSPADVGGVIYAGFGDGSVRAFNEATGTQKWSYTTGGNSAYSSPSVINGIVYIGSTDYYLYALDANTGALRWRYQTGGFIYGSPTVKGGIVYFGSYDDKVYALNAATGALVWSYTTGDAVFSSPAVWGGMVFVGSFDDKVYALDAATGASVWTYTTGNEVFASPVVIGDTVYIGSEDDSMYALEAHSGTLRWSYATGGTIEANAAFANGTVFFGSGDGKVYALTAATGALRWSFTNPAGKAIIQSACVANGVLYIGDNLNTFALDTVYGSLYTTLPAGKNYSGPIVVNGALTTTDTGSGTLVHYTLTAAQNEATSARPDPAKLRQHHLR